MERVDTDIDAEATVLEMPHDAPESLGATALAPHGDVFDLERRIAMRADQARNVVSTHRWERRGLSWVSRGLFKQQIRHAMDKDAAVRYRKKHGIPDGEPI